MSAPQLTDYHHILFIDQQAGFDLAVGCLQEGHTWEALRDALQRAAAFMGSHFPHYPQATSNGVSLARQ